MLANLSKARVSESVRMTRYVEVVKLVNYQRLCGNCVDFTFASFCYTDLDAVFINQS